MKVLSIDIDFITNKYADKISAFCGPKPHIKWWNFFNNVKEHNFKIDYENFSFLMEVFNSCSTLNNKVVFAINHDSILSELNEIEDNFDIINIDHHHDIVYTRDEVVELENFDYFNCGSWLWYLNHKNKINSYTWIKNKNSNVFNEGIVNSKTLKEYKSYFKNDLPFDIKEIKFDFIFVCLSPDFIMPEHWSYFHMLRNMYEQKIGKKVEYIQKRFEIDPVHLNFDLYKNIIIENNCDI